MREDIVKHNLYPTFDSTDKVKIIFVQKKVDKFNLTSNF